MRLLLVEDDAKLARALERAACAARATPSTSPPTATRRCGQAAVYDYDAVVLDVMLPGQRRLRGLPGAARARRWAPVLMLTARDQRGDRIRGLDAGADDYLVKPFDFGELLARLRALHPARRRPSGPRALRVGDLRRRPGDARASRAPARASS